MLKATSTRKWQPLTAVSLSLGLVSAEKSNGYPTLMILHKGDTAVQGWHYPGNMAAHISLN